MALLAEPKCSWAYARRRSYSSCETPGGRGCCATNSCWRRARAWSFCCAASTCSCGELAACAASALTSTGYNETLNRVAALMTLCTWAESCALDFVVPDAKYTSCFLSESTPNIFTAVSRRASRTDSLGAEPVELGLNF